MRASVADVLLFPPTDEMHQFHPYNFSRADTRPNLELTVDFTTLMGPSEVPGTQADLILDSVQVYLALTASVERVISSTRPIPLRVGMNLLAVADLVIRQRYRALKASTFLDIGLFDVRPKYNWPNFPGGSHTILVPVS